MVFRCLPDVVSNSDKETAELAFVRSWAEGVQVPAKTAGSRSNNTSEHLQSADSVNRGLLIAEKSTDK